MATKNLGNLPFKIGGEAESKSFVSGYRGAWFRCKIKGITKRKGKLGFVLEFYDFPDQKLEWTKLYQVPPKDIRETNRHKELMIRPPYPRMRVYLENQTPHVHEIPELTVIVDGPWRIGDLVDWWTGDSYWSGRIIELFGDGKAKIELTPPPHGQGETYEIYLDDLRPSLHWSPGHGWKIPTQEGDPDLRTIHIIEPTNQVIHSHPTMDTDKAAEGTEVFQETAGSSVKLSSSSMVSVAFSDESFSTGEVDMQKRSVRTVASDKVIDSQDKIITTDSADSSARKRICEDTDSGKTSTGPATDVVKESPHSDFPVKAGGVLHSMRSDSMEAAVLDLQECITKVKKLQAILLHGISSPDDRRPKWEFVDDHSAPTRPK